MRYRKLDSNDDMQFGHGSADYWFNQADGVGQAIKTRLGLFRGEWFLDLSNGTPWGGFPLNDAVVAQGQILGAHTQQTRDFAIKSRILDTPGVLSISDYLGATDPDTRRYLVTVTVDTIYGQLVISGGITATGGFQLDVTPLDTGGGLS